MPAVISMVTEFGNRGINTYPINTVPATLPKVLMADNRPTLSPTFWIDCVSNRTRNGPVIASRASGTRNKNKAANSVAHAKGRLIRLRHSGFTIGTVAAR